MKFFGFTAATALLVFVAFTPEVRAEEQRGCLENPFDQPGTVACQNKYDPKMRHPWAKTSPSALENMSRRSGTDQMQSLQAANWYCESSPSQDLTLTFEIQDKTDIEARVLVSEYRFYELQRTDKRVQARRTNLSSGEVVYQLQDYTIFNQSLSVVVRNDGKQSFAVRTDGRKLSLKCELQTL